MVVFILISVFLVNSFAQSRPTLTCPVQAVKKCPGYHFISSPIFHAFSPMHNFSEGCSRILSALKCVEDLYTSCSFQLKLAFELQSNVINAVCGSRKEEYIQSISCYSKPGVESNSNKCLQKLSTADTCMKVSELITCVRDVVKMTDGCSITHVWFMEELLKLYLKPYVELMNCSPIATNLTVPLKQSTVDLVQQSSIQTDLTTPTTVLAETVTSQSPSVAQTRVENGVQANTAPEISPDTSLITTAPVFVLSSVNSTSQLESLPPNELSFEQNNTGPRNLQLVSHLNSKANDQRSSKGGAAPSGKWDKVLFMLLLTLLF